MQSLSIKIPASVPVEVIRAALLSLGAQIVEKVSRKIERDFPGMSYIQRFNSADDAAKSGMDVLQDESGDWYAQCEIDGVDLAKRIRKMELARQAYNRRDGRESYTFPDASHPVYASTADYVRSFCVKNHLTH